MEAGSLKFIIVGGGPVGLTAALALSRANIDFIVLERNPSAIIDAGSNLVLSPFGTRALFQLGLQQSLTKVTCPLSGEITRVSHHGEDIGSANWYQHLTENLGDAPRVLSRHDLTSVLYHGLSPADQGKILCNKRIEVVKDTPQGVEVSCSDGTTYAGTAVIGADGAHSTVRDEMRRLAVEAASKSINDEKPFLTTYRAMWIRFPTPTLEPGLTNETHGHGAATQMFTGNETSVAGVYEQLEEPTRERIRFTKEDQSALVERLGHLPLSHDGEVTLKSAYESRTQSGLVCLEEGVVKHWSWGGKIVLIGDAAHKFTPSTGAGCNHGIIDVVVLVNELHKLLTATRQGDDQVQIHGPVVDRSALDAVFQTYQEARYDEAVEGCLFSAQVTTMAMWKTTIMRFVDQYIMSRHLLQWLLMDLSSRKLAQIPNFSFIMGEEAFVGKIPWVKSAVETSI